MREIKFAWVCRNIHFNEIIRVELTDEMLLSGYRPSWITTENCEVIAKILPTGLKDKNGVEIYEGDILLYYWKSIWGDRSEVSKFYEVVFDGGAFKQKEKGDRSADLWEEWSELEVLGNIYENPDLLSKEPFKENTTNE